VVFILDKSKLQNDGLGPDIEFRRLCGSLGGPRIAGVTLYEGEGLIHLAQEEFATDLSEYISLMVRAGPSLASSRRCCRSHAGPTESDDGGRVTVL
jgi:hypothetical protein